jgi:hypothetical protein
MTQTSDLMRKYTDIVMEGPYDSKAGVTANDAKRVQVAPNVQNKLVQFDRDQQQVDQANRTIRKMENPRASKFGDTVGGAIGDAVAGTRAAWDAGVDAFSNKTAPIPDPKRPVDVIPDPRRGTSTPRLPGQGEDRTKRSRAIDQATRPDTQRPQPTAMPRDDEPVPRYQERPMGSPVQDPPTRADYGNAIRQEIDRASSVRETRTVDLLRRLSDIVIEAEVKEVKTAKKTQDNVHKSSNDMMKPYKK